MRQRLTVPHKPRAIAPCRPPFPFAPPRPAPPRCHPLPARLGEARALGRQPYALALGKPRQVAELAPCPTPCPCRPPRLAGLATPLPSGHCRPISQARSARALRGKRKDTCKR
jgi:hypothetical protein